MVDTISLVLTKSLYYDDNGDEKDRHQAIFDELWLASCRGSKKLFYKEVDTSLGFSELPLRVKQKVIKYDGQEDYPIKNWTKKLAPSWSYELNASVDPYIKGECYFEFSIPKYLYGNNIAQFIISPFNPKYFKAKHSSWESQKRMLFERLKQFIRYFFEREFPGVEVDYSCVEIHRIDLCYNEYYASKEEALYMLEMKKRVGKKSVRDDDSNYQEYGGGKGAGITVNSKFKYRKIYHKGSEYRKTGLDIHIKHNQRIYKKIKFKDDRIRQTDEIYSMRVGTAFYNKKDHDNWKQEKKRLENEVKELRRKLIDIDFLQKEADKILRYEVEFKPRVMSYIFRNKIFRKNCPVHLRLKKEYNKINSLTRSGTLFIKPVLYDAHGDHQTMRTNENKYVKVVKTKMNDEGRLVIPKNAGYRLVGLTKSRLLLKEGYVYYRKEDAGKLTSDSQQFKRVVPKSDERFFNKMRKSEQFTNKFFFMLPENVVRYHKGSNSGYDELEDMKSIPNYGRSERKAPFSSELLGYMVDQLWLHIKEFEVKDLPDEMSFEMKVDEYNRRVKFKKTTLTKSELKHLTSHQKKKRGLMEMDKAKMVALYEALQSGTIEEYRKRLGATARTVRNWILDLNRLDITRNHLFDGRAKVIVRPKTDFDACYTAMLKSILVTHYDKGHLVKYPYFGANEQLKKIW